MISLTDPQPLEEAVRNISERTPIGSALRSAEWAQVPVALRETAFFSARVEHARLLQEMKDGVTRALTMARREDGTLQRRDQFVAEMRKLARELGLGPTDPKLAGGLQDITSIKRLRLIWDTNIRRAEGFARWKVQNGDPAVVEQWPAQELVRVEARRRPRDWPNRWRLANGPGNLAWPRMVARKDDPVWLNISAFNTPWPPFDYNSGMGLRSLDRLEAEALGVMTPEDKVVPGEADMRDRMRASTRGIDADVLRWLKGSFGDQVKVKRGEIEWAGSTARRGRSGTARSADQAAADRGLPHDLAMPDHLAAPPQVASSETDDGPTIRARMDDLRARISELERLERALVGARPGAEGADRSAIAAESRRVTASLRAHREAIAEAAHLPAAARGSLALDTSTVGNVAARARVIATAERGARAVERLVHPSLLPARVAVRKTARARASASASTIFLKSTTPEHVSAHEIGHCIEFANPALHADAKAYRASRAAPGETPRRLRDIYPGWGFAASEIAYEDEWDKGGRGADMRGAAYAGKVYPYAATEIVSCAIERLARDPAAFAAADPGYFDWAIKVLRSPAPGHSVVP